MNKKVLFISYFFPPLGGGGVIRVTKFVKFLPCFGWKPYVLTVREGFYPVKDETLLGEIPKEAETIRIKYLEPGFWFRYRLWQSFLRYFLYPLFFLPDSQALWVLPAVCRGYKLIKKEQIKIVFTSSSPASDHLIGWMLKKLTGVKWVADFRDDWTKSPYVRFTTPIHRNIAELLERSILKNADMITTVSDGLTDIYRRSLFETPEKFQTITNGFDEDDFEKIQRSNIKMQNQNAKFKIIHAGSFYIGRQADTFLMAFDELKLKNAKVEFIGSDKRISHQEAIRKMFAADILLLILSPQDGPEVMTGKIFEYLRAKKPILAVAPKNSGAARLIKKLKAGEVADPLDKDAIKEKLQKLYQKWEKNKLPRSKLRGIPTGEFVFNRFSSPKQVFDPEASDRGASGYSTSENKLFVPSVDLEQFERKNLTKNLAGIFGTLLPSKNRSEKIKVCFIGNLDSPQNKLLISNLKKENLDISFITIKNIKYPGVKTYYLEPSVSTAWYFIKSLWKIKKLIKKIKPDIVHAQDLVFAGIWAYLAGHRPYAATIWGSDVLRFDKFIKIEQKLIQKTLLGASILTGPALHLGARAQTIAGQKIDYDVIHFGVDKAKFLSVKSQNFKKKHRFKKIIFCPRAIGPIYNTDILIKAFYALSKNIPVHLALLGNNASESYLVEIEKMLIKYQLLDKVTILPNVSDNELIDVYNCADLVVTLASSDGCPSSFLEAMLLGKKIVVTDIAFVKEWRIGDNIFTVPVRDVFKTTQRMIMALRFPEQKWQKYAVLNRNLVIKRADAGENAQKLLEKYQNL